MKKMNWKVRLKNKTFLIAIAGNIIAFIYELLTLFEITPHIDQSSVIGAFLVFLNILAAMGIVSDPTTEGIGDSERALTYETENDARINEESK